MISLLARFFCKSDGKGPAQLRTAYGILCGAVGIGLNLLLFLGKFFAGTLSGSVAITADAFNNLSDAGSSVVTLLGFRIAAKAPGPGPSLRPRPGGVPLRSGGIHADFADGRGAGQGVPE